jgi:TRAP transporter TAXI family solute receptor
MKKTTFIFLLLAFLSSLEAAKFITIGTGSINGLYYPTGAAICKLTNTMKKENGMRCAIESTHGSSENIKSVIENKFQFAIAQSDIIYQAFHGKKQFSEKPMKKIRTIMTIYPELLTLISTKKASIKNIKGIKNKNISLGAKNSGTNSILKALFSYDKTIKPQKEINIASSNAPTAMKDENIDGYFFVVGHPNENIKEVANFIDIDLVPIENSTYPKLDKFLKEHPYYAKGVIGSHLYKGVEKQTKSFGVKATLITSADMDEASVRAIVQAILENFDKFKSLNSAFSKITKKSLLEGLGAPLHDAAKKYYQEKGLL